VQMSRSDPNGVPSSQRHATTIAELHLPRLYILRRRREALCSPRG
jgi:hypothetical protein